MEIEMEYTTFEPYEWRMHPLNQLVKYYLILTIERGAFTLTQSNIAYVTKVRQIVFYYFKKHWKCLRKQYDRLLTLIKGKGLHIHDIYNGQKCSIFGS
jgi:hypothetical protein